MYWMLEKIFKIRINKGFCINTCSGFLPPLLGWIDLYNKSVLLLLMITTLNKVGIYRILHWEKNLFYIFLGYMWSSFKYFLGKKWRMRNGAPFHWHAISTVNILLTYLQGGTQKTELTYKNCVCILTCLNVSHLQSTLHVMQCTYGDVFPLLKTVSELIDFDAFWCFCHFFLVSPLPHGQNVSPWGLYSSRETRKGSLGRHQVNREGGARGPCCFWSKTAEHSAQCGQEH